MLSEVETKILIREEQNISTLTSELSAVLWAMRYELEHGRTPLAEDIALFQTIDHKLSCELGRLRKVLADIEGRCD